MIFIAWRKKWITVHKSTFLLEAANMLHQYLKLIKVNNASIYVGKKLSHLREYWLQKIKISLIESNAPFQLLQFVDRLPLFQSLSLLCSHTLHPSHRMVHMSYPALTSWICIRKLYMYVKLYLWYLTHFLGLVFRHGFLKLSRTFRGEL